MGLTDFFTGFQVMGTSKNYTVLIGRPWIHAVGAIPLTLHQLFTNIWENHEIFIHNEGTDCSYPGLCIPIIEEFSEGTDF